MKICVTAETKALDSKVDVRFGRCRNFIIIDTDTGEFEAFENINAASPGGAGIQSAQFAASKGAKAVLTGNVGPNAVATLKAAGIEIYTDISGTVSEALAAFKAVKLKATQDPSVGSHFGMGK